MVHKVVVVVVLLETVFLYVYQSRSIMKSADSIVRFEKSSPITHHSMINSKKTSTFACKQHVRILQITVVNQSHNNNNKKVQNQPSQSTARRGTAATVTHLLIKYSLFSPPPAARDINLDARECVCAAVQRDSCSTAYTRSLFFLARGALLMRATSFCTLAVMQVCFCGVRIERNKKK